MGASPKGACVTVPLLNVTWSGVLSHWPLGSSSWVVDLHRWPAAVPLQWCRGEMPVAALTTGCSKQASISKVSC